MEPDSTQQRPPSRFWLNASIILWSIAFVILCARTLFLKVDQHSVYHVFTNAAENWLHSDSLYTVGSTEEFRYSPLVAAFFVPFEFLPPRLGQFLWRSINFFVYLSGLLYCCKIGIPEIRALHQGDAISPSRGTPGERRGEGLLKFLTPNQLAALLLLVLPLSIGSLNNAQSNPLVIGLLLISIAAVMQNKWTLSASAITLATLFKLYPIVVGLLLILMFPRRITWRLLLGLAVGALLPFVLQRADYVLHQYALWKRYLVTEDRQRGPITDWYRDLRAVWRIYIAPMHQNTYLIVEIITGAFLAAICLIGRFRNWPRIQLLTFLLSLSCCWMTVLGPATESATYIFLAPALAWFLIEAKTKPWRIAYAVCFGLFITSQAAINIPNGRWFRDLLQPLPVAGLLFLVLLSIDATRRFIPRYEGGSMMEDGG